MGLTISNFREAPDKFVELKALVLLHKLKYPNQQTHKKDKLELVWKGSITDF
jgi:hypothetical protein